MQESKHFKVDVLAQGDQILIHCPSREEASILSRLIQCSEDPAILTVSHAFANGKTRIYDSGNYDGEAFFQDRLVPPEARAFIEKHHQFNGHAKVIARLRKLLG